MEGLHGSSALMALSSEWHAKLADVDIDNEDTHK
jgi:hypothetical protein